MDVMFLLLGLFIGYALSRKKDDKPIVEVKPSEPKPVAENIFADDFTRCQFTQQEIDDMTSGRIPTIG